ncbi:MAG: RcnB family protein, partial [Alphaproteobacteria bacterium]|nr:RcnB family protein [Alphaproteobacteria bacterium]
QGQDRGRPGPERRAPDGQRWQGQERRDDGDDRRRYEERQRYDDGRPSYGQAPRPNYMSPAPGVAARRGPPDGYRGGGVVDDYRRYRLRPPPQGYDWVRMGNGFALVERGSGRVFDRVN